MNKLVHLHKLMSTYSGFDHKMARNGYTLMVHSQGTSIKAIDNENNTLFRVELGVTERWDSSILSFEDLTLFDRTIFNGTPKMGMTFQGVECTAISTSIFDSRSGCSDEQSIEIASEESRFQASVVSDLDIDKYYKLLCTYNEAARVIPIHDKMIITYNDNEFSDTILDDIISTMERLHREKA